MDVAIAAPCPAPYQIGGPENLWRGLEDYINQETPHRLESIKLPSRELRRWELVDSYRRFGEPDLTGFDVAVSSKCPAWMTPHPRHVADMQHRLRGLHDTRCVLAPSGRNPTTTTPVDALRRFSPEVALALPADASYAEGFVTHPLDVRDLKLDRFNESSDALAATTADST